MTAKSFEFYIREGTRNRLVLDPDHIPRRLRFVDPEWRIGLSHDERAVLRVTPRAGHRPVATCGGKLLKWKKSGDEYTAEIKGLADGRPDKQVIVRMVDEHDEPCGATTVRVTPPGRGDELTSPV